VEIFFEIILFVNLFILKVSAFTNPETKLSPILKNKLKKFYLKLNF